ncbi:MAG: SCO family protein [Bacteroidota bacterium]
MRSACHYFSAILIIATLVSCKGPAAKREQATRVLPFYTSADFTPQWIEKNSTAYNTIPIIPAFQFVDQDSMAVTEKTFAGKIYVADFFFTACPGICKRLTTNLSLVQTAFKEDEDVLLLSHSVTPENDNVARLQQYANAFGVIKNKWHLVTGKREEIYGIARNAYFADEDMGVKKNSSDFLHTENMLLIDKHRRIRGVYKGTSVKDVNDLIADIKVLKLEE